MNARTLEHHYLHTQLLGGLIDQVEECSPLLLLDVGYGVAETVAYFGERRCRLHFSGFYELLGPKKLNSELEGAKGAKVEEVDLEEFWFGIFQKAMDYPPDTRFDLCLFWDFFSYLDTEALNGFVRALSPYVNKDTLAHCFAVSNTTTVIPEREYGVLNRDQLIFRPPGLRRPRMIPRSRSKLAEQLNILDVKHSVLHQGGMLELTFKGKQK